MFGNGQMGIVIPGARVGVEVNNSDHIKNQLEELDINTWEEFIEQSKSKRLYGNTKLTDLPILVSIYRNELHLGNASRDVDYAPSVRANGELQYTTEAIKFRLRRMNVDNMFDLIEPFIEKGIVTRENIRHILEGKEKPTSAESRIRNGAFFKYYAKWYVTDGIEFIMDDYGVTYEVATEVLANNIDVDVNIVRHWRDLEVENIMVEPTY